MPSRIGESIPPFPENVPTADIFTVDFDRLREGDPEEARKVYEASKGYGFFYLSNTHVDYDFMFDLANQTFNLDPDEKMKYEMGNTGSYFGYKMSGSNYVDSKGTPDKSEFYNISKDDVMRNGQYKDHPLEHPETIKRRRAELEEFMASCHRVVLMVLRTLGEQLGLAPDTLPDLHRLDRVGGDQARVTHAPPVSADTITLGEHTDFGSVTVLFNQLGGLQVINPESQDYKYVKPQPGCAIINLGDALVKLVGGRLYSGVHRVVGPPGEQAQSPRHSVVYFSRPNGEVKLKSLLDPDDGEEAMTADDWIAQRAKLRRTANFQGESTYHASRGTEHTKSRDKPKLDKPAREVEAV
ncbi:uncharacterized protein LTR77_007645 [Saxophila tyrrhenica]|uniref:Fe2OG dioxygenase domain-containing protein n=1 Tax=Saxophila tyrrhenica TaxID=1690608 RepID=A0AAV9P2M6_9PEZI|nr:hypothetical protein LTR77_007645 [Saxophila tyrrhenica]